MSSQRVLGAAGIVVAGAAGYYLYNAGGNPKVATKMAETDASRASAKVKQELPGSAKQAQKQGEEWAARAGSKVDAAVADAKAKGRQADSSVSKAISDAEAKLGQFRAEAGAKFEDARKDTKQNVDAFDKTVERKTAEAKSGISSWFGGK